MTNPRATPRLRRELLLRLMLLLLVLVAASGIAGAYFTQLLTDRVFDQWLLDAASSLAAEVRFSDGEATLELPAAARAMLSYDDTDNVYFNVVQGAITVAGDAQIPSTQTRLAHYEHGDTYDGSAKGQRLRVALVNVRGPAGTTPVQVRVAETTRKRDRMRSEILFLLLPLALLLIAAAAAINYAVQRTLKPLEALAARWNERSHASLNYIDASDVPRELTPFTTALNDLLARMRSMLIRERQFSATVAHQLRTPLAGLQLGLARAKASADVETARAAIVELESTCQRLGRLIQQLLALGRIEQEGSHTIEFVQADLVALAQDIGSGFVELAAHRDIVLELYAPPQPVIVRMHPDLVAEAIANLLDNALCYTPRGGVVAIAFNADPPSLSVSDSGPGIAEAERSLVFGRFVRGNAGSEKGSGLGLSIVRDIALLHNAEVLLDASALGGLRVTLRFAPLD